MNKQHHRRRLAWRLLLAGTLLVSACGGPPTVDTDPGTAADPAHDSSVAWADPGLCRPLPGQAARGGDLVLALAEAVDPSHAPVATTHAERVVFANLYETLVRLSCEGRLEPGLAARWERLDGGRRWRLHLREGAVFWNGEAVTTRSVIGSWRRSEEMAAATGRPFPGLWLAPGSQGLVPLDPATLEIRLAEPQDDLLPLLAHPDLAVAAWRQGWLWPLGSGPCRLAADSDLPLPDLVCQPNLHHPEPPRWRRLTFRILAGSDPRELLTTGTDLAVVRDRRAAAYYAQLEGLRSAPLPWDRLYVLLVPPGSGLATTPVASLAQIATHAAATASESRAWSSLFFHPCRPAPCPQLQGPTVGTLPLAREPDPVLFNLAGQTVAYAAADRDARALAERIVAFQPSGFAPSGQSGPALAGSLQAGLAAGFIVRLDAGYATACLTLASLLARADWLQQDIAVAAAGDPCRAATILSDETRAVPVAATRARLVWRGELAGLRLTHDGVPLVGGLGWARPEDLP